MACVFCFDCGVIILFCITVFRDIFSFVLQFGKSKKVNLMPNNISYFC